jgi:hypothetical protein
MSDMPEIDKLLAADEKNVPVMRTFFARYQGLPELLNTVSLVYSTCTHACGLALSPESNTLPRDTPPDSRVVEEALVKRYRALLFARIGNLYNTAVADLLRMRLTAPLGYLRLQCESLALVKLMWTNAAAAQLWAKDGLAFYKKHQREVKAILGTYNLADTYDDTSDAALHSRLIGLAFGYTSIIDCDRILVQEFNPDEPHYFMIDVIYRVLPTQARIFANLPDAVPEIKDLHLLKTRIPQCIEDISSFKERARAYFASYLPDREL